MTWECQEVPSGTNCGTTFPVDRVADGLLLGIAMIVGLLAFGAGYLWQRR